MNKGLVSLSVGTFALGITEFMMMGILVSLAGSLGVSVAQAGHLISAYAMGVCVGAPVLLFARKLKLKNIMLILAAMIALGNLAAAFAPNFWTLFAARFVCGLPHGAYFGVGAIVARKLADPGKEVTAVSLMVAGMTVATLVGVPLATWITNTLSWRVAFMIVSAAGFITFFAVRRHVRDVGRLPDEGFKGQFRFLSTLPPWLIFGGVIFGQIGIYCWYSYIDPQLTEVAGFPTADLSWLMVLAGFGMFAGNLVSGRLSDRFKPSAVAAAVETAAIPVLVAAFLFGHYQVAIVIIMMAGTAALFGSSSPLQSSIVGYSRGGEMLGAACIQIAYNAGNAIAAAIGSAAIASGMSYSSTAILGVPFVAVGSVLLYVLYFRFERKSGGK